MFGSLEEDERRMANYEDNLVLIEDHNKLYYQGSVSYMLGINEFVYMVSY